MRASKGVSINETTGMSDRFLIEGMIVGHERARISHRTVTSSANEAGLVSGTVVELLNGSTLYVAVRRMAKGERAGRLDWSCSDLLKRLTIAGVIGTRVDFQDLLDHERAAGELGG